MRWWMMCLLSGWAMQVAGQAERVREPVVPLDRIVAIVNNEVITRSELNDRIRLVLQQLRQQNVDPPSAERITPACAHYALCGGCSLQHMDEDFQLRHKQGVLLELLRHQGKGIVPDVVADALRGPQFGYRRKARLGVKFVAAKGGVLVGFRPVK